MEGVFEKLKKAISISRPLFWLAPPFAYFLGLMLGGTLRGPYETIEFLLLSFPLSFFIYAVNDIHDLAGDRINPRKGGMWGMRLEKKDVQWAGKLAFIFAAAILFTAALSMNLLHFLIALFGILLCYFYSAPPIRLKNIPLIDSLASGGYGLVAFALGCSLSGSLLFLHPYVILGALCISSIHAITTIMDYDIERKTGERTFATVLGPRAPALFAFVIFLASLYALLTSAFPSFFLLLGLCLATLFSFLLVLFPKPHYARMAFKALWVYAVLIAYYYLLKYVVLGQWQSFAEEFPFARLFWVP